MPGIDDLIETLKNPGEEGVPDTVYDDLKKRYSETESNAESASAKVGELTEQNTAFAEEITRLKAKNWDVISLLPKDGDEQETEPEEPEFKGMDSLFG